ncbi:hypothetical protein BU15DRAFT_84310 [Melanogaster broomeanus]|nr:hypothetical protein BU15DRAFT_84310 [Melanogaster broomeanus]
MSPKKQPTQANSNTLNPVVVDSAPTPAPTRKGASATAQDKSKQAKAKPRA